MSVSQNYPLVQPSLSLDFANVKALDSRVTFTRASSARYYNGVTTSKAEENLVLRSEEFDNVAWAKVRASITANSTTAPDGTSTADSLIEDATASNTHFTNQGCVLVTGLSYVFSVFAKANTRTIISLVGNAASTAGYFDLSAGTASGTGASIVSVGNGWYRCILSYTSVFTGTTSNIIYLVSSGTTISYTGDGTSGVFLWGAQLEQRSAVTAYTATTTQPITNYIPTLLTATDNVARFDHNPTTGESLGLLIEEQRTNLLTRSEEFDNASWAKTRATVTTNQAVAPDGTLTADKFVATAVAGTHSTTQLITTLSASYASSVYVKAGEYTRVTLREASTTGDGATFDLVSGTVVTNLFNGIGSIQSVGNGWYRCAVVSTITAGSNRQFNITMNTNAGSGNETFTGDGYSGIYIWGAQLEVGAFPTSYIPTVASQVTRSADAASITGANFTSWYRADEGTLYGEANGLSTAGNRVAALSSTTSSNYHIISLVITTTVANGSTQASFSRTVNANQFYKNAYAYRVNDFALSTDGAAVSTDNLGLLPNELNRLEIGGITAGSYFVGSGCIRKISYYPIRLSNAQLQALTG